MASDIEFGTQLLLTFVFMTPTSHASTFPPCLLVSYAGSIPPPFSLLPDCVSLYKYPPPPPPKKKKKVSRAIGYYTPFESFAV